MSLMAGIYSLREEVAPDDVSVQVIRQCISRGHDTVQEFRDDRFFLAKVDIGCYGAPAFLTGDSVAAATGEPYLSPIPGKVNSRAEDIAALAHALRLGDLSPLRQCMGTFSLCLYNPASKELLIGTDRTGYRAVYFHLGADHLYFSSSLRVIEAIPAVPKEMDLRGVTEMAVMGVPLGDRTQFARIKNLRGGEVLLGRSGHVSRQHYFLWRDLAPTRHDRESFLDVAHETFLSALETRSNRDARAVSFLSGGLDSRVIVAGLRELKKDVFTITFNYPHLQDGPIAKDFAAAIGARHLALPVDHKAKGRLLQASVPSTMQYPPDFTPTFPRLVFSGDGGSVGVGFVYMDTAIVELMRAGRIDDAIHYHMRNKQLPTRLFRREALAALRDSPPAAVRSEIELAASQDPAKDFHIYLMENDQRRHLHYMYEDLDVTRTEFLLPFMDGRFLDLINSAPVDWFLLHGFYYDWLKRFPAPTSALPWQTYPGHLPCPVAAREEGRPQWELTRWERFEAYDDVFRRCGRRLLTQSFPGSLMRRGVAWLALGMHGVRIRNYAHILQVADVFQDNYVRSKGKVAWAGPTGGNAGERLQGGEASRTTA